jgi:hypothetical protein
LEALGQDQLDQLIVIGGWCLYLYTKYLWKQDAPFLRTVDIDFAVMHPNPEKFSLPVYDRLLKAGFKPELIDLDNENRVKFIYRDKELKVDIDFVTSAEKVSKRPLILKKPYVECFPIDEVEILFRVTPLCQTFHFSGKNLNFQFANPAVFLVHKGIIIDQRMPTGKSNKDLASIAFILRFASNQAEIINDVLELKNQPMFKDFKKKLKELFKKRGDRGYQILEQFYQTWNVPTTEIAREIEADFQPLLSKLDS